MSGDIGSSIGPPAVARAVAVAVAVAAHRIDRPDGLELLTIEPDHDHLTEVGKSAHADQWAFG